MSTNRYSVTFRDGKYAVIRNTDWHTTVTERRTLAEARNEVMRLTARDTQNKPEIDDLIRQAEEGNSDK